MTVLVSMNDTVDWKFVTKNCVAVLKGGWVFEAGAATLAVCGLFAALRAAVYWQCRQVVGAIRAYKLIAAVGATEQAVTRQKAVL